MFCRIVRLISRAQYPLCIGALILIVLCCFVPLSRKFAQDYGLLLEWKCPISADDVEAPIIASRVKREDLQIEIVKVCDFAKYQVVVAEEAVSVTKVKSPLINYTRVVTR